MSVLINETELPQELTRREAVEAAYAAELAEVASKLQRGLPALVECDKDLAPFLYLNLRNRLRAVQPALPLPRRPATPGRAAAGAMPMGMIGTMIAQLREAVRGAVERRVVVLPHLDLLTTSQGGLTAEAREVIPLLYENPELVWLGFKDPSFPLPQVIENLFPHRISLLGIARARLRHLVTAARAASSAASSTRGRCTSTSPASTPSGCASCCPRWKARTTRPTRSGAYRQLRQATLGGTLEVPNIDLDKRHRRLRQGQEAAAQRDPRRARPQGPADRARSRSSAWRS